MENNLPVISKRVWSLVRVAFFMLRKEISKGKIMMNLNMILRRRSKLAGKAIANLISHHPNHGGSTSNQHSHNSHQQFTSSREYEYSCSNTPNHFFSIGKRHHNHKHSAQARLTHDDEVTDMNAIKAVVEMLNNDQTIVEVSPGFPLRDDDDEKDNQVDKAAEDFIKRFYSQLRNQE
ncbi:uncharacterized protein LOC131654166 [Vicia villosa]|uniref:uncharacterized protein LOC131654165 n=1 Tax=Vicia villosa TaxID=3911 RepID=UPI00273BF206|nr:uncharacterized protein LOC131654165 [Vicia villosa]XP_058780573.1 uncharacterized protein LOC131654166 [Vicia villosa]